MIWFLKQTGADNDNPINYGDNRQMTIRSLSIGDCIKRKSTGGWNSAMVLLGESLAFILHSRTKFLFDFYLSFLKVEKLLLECVFSNRILFSCRSGAVNQGLATLAFFGVGVNLVLFLTRVLGQDNATAANNVSKWTGTVYLFSLVGAFLSDSYWGRYLTCAIFQLIFVSVGILSSRFKNLH